MAQKKEIDWKDAFDVVDDFSHIIVDNGTQKGKKITKDQVKAILATEGSELTAIQGGTTALPTILNAPPTNEFRWAEASPGEYKFGSEPNMVATTGKRWRIEWVGGVPSLKDMGELPKTTIIDNLSTESPTEALSAKQGKVLNDELNVGLVQELPNGYKNLTWNIPLSTGWKYYDSRCIVTDINSLSVINMVSAKAGSVKILAVGMDGFTIYEETKTAIVGLNAFMFSDITLLEGKSFYPAIELVSGGAEMKSSSSFSPNGTEMWTEYNVVNWRHITYPLAYSIEFKDGGVKGKLASLQVMVKSDTTNIQENLSKYGKVALDAKEFVIEETINTPSGATLEGVFGMSVLKKGASLAGDILKIDNKEDIKISNVRLVGNLSEYSYGMNGINSGAGIVDNLDEALLNTYIGTNNGISIKNSERLILDSIQFHKLNGIGLKVEGVGKNYIHGMKSSNLFFYNCYKGVESTNEHEFSIYDNITISLCQIGLDIGSGNLNIATPIITRCRVGHILRDGFNNAHGIISNAEIKHNELAGILIDGVTNGQLYEGLQMQYADLVIRNSKGIFIPNLFFTDGKITCNGGTGKNLIKNLWAFGTPTIDNTGNLIIENNINWNV